MTRLVNRMVLSHLLVAVLAGLATVLVVRFVAVARWDGATREGRAGQSGTGPGRGGGRGGGGPAQDGAATGAGEGFREQFVDSVDQAVWIGVLVGLVAALVLGLLAARALARPVKRLGEATRQIAGGSYAVTVPEPSTQELAGLARDVNTLGRSLQETEARRTRLLGEVAHEMRTPLTVIDGYVEAMIDGVVPVDEEQLGRLGAETLRLRRLSDDLSQLSRAEEGRLDLRPEPGDLAATVSAAASRLAPQAEDAGIALSVAGEALEVPHDAERMAQVVTNLVGNALRATPAGGRIEVGTARRGDWAEVSVSDTGIGLSEADLDRVFERFYRAPAPGQKKAAGGSGIGLTIARGIVRGHGGELTAASAGPGRGARFTARIPLAGRTQSVGSA